jgi:hypothetical protein
MLERLARPANSNSRNCKRSASNQILHASPSFNLFDLRLQRCSGERCGRANSWTNAEKNLFYADADSASQKENCYGGKKEIADANTNSYKKTIAIREGTTYSVAHRIAEEKEAFAYAGGIAGSNAKENKSFANAVARYIPSSKEKAFADSGTI